jgi:hypothetical protein
MRQNGYMMLLRDGRYIGEHVIVWEAAHGPVLPNHQVHHLNGVRDDNRLENLVCLTRQEHKTVHQHTDGAYRSYISSEDLLASYRRRWSELGHPPNSTECGARNDMPDWRTFWRRFGSIERVRELAHP